MSDPAYFQTRFQSDPARGPVWRELTRFIQRDMSTDGVVVELGCGYGDFINTVQADRKVAVDLNPECRAHLDEDVEFHQRSVVPLDFLDNASVDTVFASNLVEHLSRSDIEQLLGEIRRVLKPEGRCILLQPNYRYCASEYFDDYTHLTPLSHVSLSDWLEASGFQVLRCVPRLLPLSMKSRVPKHPLLVRLYLALPVKPLARQMYLVATPDREAGD